MNAECNLAISDREELIYLLTEAAEFEHAVMCTYLYAQWSLKRDRDGGISEEEQQALARWRGLLRSVALEEMLHLALVNNLLASVGAAPHFARPDFPIPRGHFPAAVDLHLAPFNTETMKHFVYLERPEGIDIRDGRSFSHECHYPRVIYPDLLTPTTREYSSQGHLYHGIAQGLRRLSKRLGEDRLFAGHGEAQLGSAEFPIPGIFKVHDLDSALRAIEEIVHQGEGAPAHREDSHYARFAMIYAEYRAMKMRNPEFAAAQPVAVNPVLTEYNDREGVIRITDPQTRRVVDLGNSIYALMLQTLAQICAPMPLPVELRMGLSEASCELMLLTTKIGEAAARLPIGDHSPGVNAGISFALPRSFGQLVQAHAAQILAERTMELTEASRALGDVPGLRGLDKRLKALAETLNDLHRAFRGQLHVSAATAKSTASPESKGVGSQAVMPATSADNEASTKNMTLRFDTARCIHSRRCVLSAPRVFLANVEGPWLHPEEDTVEHLVQIAHACPSGAITYDRKDGGAQEPAPQVNVISIRENGPYAVHADINIVGREPLFRATLCRCGKSQNKPFCDNSHIKAEFQASGEPATLPSDPLEERSGVLKITPLRNGPLEVQGPAEICSGTGRTVSRLLSTKLCRCGGSATKPFCDGTHQRIGFKSD
ncbi:MAG: ferritin-like domain-containing protein [Xanthomonadales bacterium]|nr:ferritin-like domain-containing protein [Xanthomonadales bacterium]